VFGELIEMIEGSNSGSDMSREQCSYTTTLLRSRSCKKGLLHHCRGGVHSDEHGNRLAMGGYPDVNRQP
jgi:hypothetical protein